MTTAPAPSSDHLEDLAYSGGTSELAALTVFDRCDSPDCSSQAYVRARLSNGLDLVFCGHHGHNLASTLAGRGAVIRDDSGLLA